MDRYSLFSGMVVHGDEIGRTMGFPTLNIAFTQGVIPSDGVYVVETEIDDVVYYGMMSIGNRPTFNDSADKTIEIHLLHVNENMYGKKVKVVPLQFVRPNKKFTSADELKLQLEKDKIIADQFIKNRYTD
ncbi:MAG: riboflavin kinase [Bacteroidales bacterium]|jgi:riboflavin kinase/FMN adenylyltransferase|nr:riboflavin kinase [Bacteroidales bacterium]